MKTYLSILALFLSGLIYASERDLSQLNPMTARAFLVNQEIRPGQLSDLQIELTLQEGFFAYGDQFRLKVLEPQAIETGELFIDPIVEFDDKISKKKKRGVHLAATLKTQLDIPARLSADVNQLKMRLTYIACTEKFCLTSRDLDLATSVIVQAAPKESIASSAFIERQIDDNLIYALILIFFFGILTSLTPCVYPLIPITLAVLGANKDKTRLTSFFVSLSYVFGIGITYALLGVAAAQTGQLFGSLISHPIVVLSMSLIFFLMGLSLLGLFEIQPPHFIRSRMNQTQTQKGYLGAFISGLLAGVIASPCVGPVLVGVLAYIAKSQNSVLGFALLFTFAMGFGILFILLGTFSQLSGKLPRSGAWMNGIKTILALVLFGLSFYYAAPLLKQYLPKSATTEEKKAGVVWQTFSKEKVSEAAAQNKPVIIDFYADWCVACVEMEQLTFNKQEVMELSKQFVMLKIDATLPSKQINQWQKLYKVYGLPTMIFIDQEGKVREDLVLTGFEEATDFAKRMKEILDTKVGSPEH